MLYNNFLKTDKGFDTDNGSDAVYRGSIFKPFASPWFLENSAYPADPSAAVCL